jgi:ketosteroid isomerase-like protein
MSSTDATIHWLAEFADAVRMRDYARGRGMFAPEAIGFGTIAERAVGLDWLVNDQWRPVWTATRGFAFDLATLAQGGEEPIYWAAAQWSSFGRDGAGFEVERRGRATIVLARRDRRLLAVHTHFSFVPSGVITPSPDLVPDAAPLAATANTTIGGSAVAGAAGRRQ